VLVAPLVLVLLDVEGVVEELVRGGASLVLATVLPKSWVCRNTQRQSGPGSQAGANGDECFEAVSHARSPQPARIRGPRPEIGEAREDLVCVEADDSSPSLSFCAAAQRGGCRCVRRARRVFGGRRAWKCSASTPSRAGAFRTRSSELISS
jgi:hypothetical protein